MAATGLIWLAALLGLALAGFGFWRYIWFFRNPSRQAPAGDGLVSPADGTVVYVKEVEPRGARHLHQTRSPGLHQRHCPAGPGAAPHPGGGLHEPL